MSHSVQIPAEIEREMTPAVRAFFEAQRRAWQKRVDELEARVAQLERELKKLWKFQRPEPPSAEESTGANAVGTPEVLPKLTSKTKRKRGGQPGHPKSERTLLPSDECDEVIPLLPTECRCCGETLEGVDAEPWRHQVWELPEIKPLDPLPRIDLP